MLCLIMNSHELTKQEVLELLKTFKRWMAGPNPTNNRPEEFQTIYGTEPNTLKMILGMGLHLYLWFLTQLGAIIAIPSLIIWASKTRLKYDNLYFEPKSCGYTSSYADMGIGYLKMGMVTEAIECLRRSWHVYPCAHNTSYGLKLKLYKKPLLSQR